MESRRRSLSTPSESNSLYNSFLSRLNKYQFPQPQNEETVIPSKSVSAMTYRKSSKKKLEAVLGVKAEDIYATKKSSKFGSLFRKRKSITLNEFPYIHSDDSTSRQSSVSIYSSLDPESIYGSSNEKLPVHEEEPIQKESTLSKRLSGGHFGSAGGLLLSIVSDPPEDIATSMINWKRKSDQTLEQINTLLSSESAIQLKYTVPSRALPPQPLTEEETTPHILIEDEEKDPKGCASRLWLEDESFVQREQIAEWLGQSKNAETLQEYMTFFDFSTLRLDTAFRKVCSKLYFRAEAQQIDRILEAFAKRYWQCNPKSLFGSADIVYAVVYSLLLLNTDLHVAQGNYARMTRQEFVRNTMSTVQDQKQIDLQTNPKSETYMIAWEINMESYLKDMYISVKNNQILQPMQQHTMNNKRMSIAGRRMTEIKRSFNTIIHKSGSIRESTLFLDELTLSRKSTISIPRESFTSSYSLLTPKSFNIAPTSYAKEGIVMRKHLLESKNQKAKHREWKECLLVVGQGEFKMYGLPYECDIKKNVLSDSTLRKDSSSLFSNEEPRSKWAAYSQLIGTVDLNHTLSNALPPPGYNRSRPFVFALQQANGGVYLIQVSHHDQINDWVETCNYWAARLSKVPLQGGIGNIEYGWGDCLNDAMLENRETIMGDYAHDPDTLNLSVWVPPAPDMVRSNLDEEAQLETLQCYVEQLNEEMDHHREIKDKIFVKFRNKSHNQSKALTNWESKSNYMLHEIIKYQNYCNALEKSIKESLL